MTASNKFIKHFRDLQAGESEKAGAAETLAYLNGLILRYLKFLLKFFFSIGEITFQEYEKRVREANTDYSNVSVGKVLNTREAEIVDIDKLIDEMSDLDDLSGLSSSNSSASSDESEKKGETSNKRKKNDNESQAKRRRRKKQDDSNEESDDDNDDDDESEEKVLDPNEMRNRMVQHLEQMRLAKQKKKSNRKNYSFSISIVIFSEQTNKSKQRKRPIASVINLTFLIWLLIKVEF